MISNYLIASFSWFICAFAFYKIHKLWYRDVTQNKKLSHFQVRGGSFSHWVVIVL